jgi:hypothetical protein
MKSLKNLEIEVKSLTSKNAPNAVEKKVMIGIFKKNRFDVKSVLQDNKPPRV